jgi:hypothetical protein
MGLEMQQATIVPSSKEPGSTSIIVGFIPPLQIDLNAAINANVKAITSKIQTIKNT